MILRFFVASNGNAKIILWVSVSIRAGKSISMTQSIKEANCKGKKKRTANFLFKWIR